MLTKKSQEQDYVCLQFEDLYSAANDLQTLAQSSELMSCGGMNLPAQYESLPLKNSTQILTLPTHFSKSKILKNWSFYEDLQNPVSSSSEDSEEEPIEIGSSILVKKYVRDCPQ
ncbi:MAG: hypothetical protein HQM15_03030 [Deltaproteobacteria bacterium]|nr:hypothetical protein [Deltaproteobacteria bacterium]